MDTNSENNLDTRGVPIIGLTSEEVRERIDKGLTNHTDISTQKTVGQIVKSNLLTYFNLIFLILTVLLCIVGSFRNLTFLPVIIGNTVIGIFQELRAKKTLDKMSMLNAPHSIVVRDGEQQQIQSEELVKDDIIILSAGNQICADATVLSGSISVNEALLTGESDEIKKKSGDRLMSGSFVVSGQCYAKLDKVGNESYISQLTAQAKAMGDGEQSEMIRYINKLVKWVGIIIIPVGIILFCQAYIMNGETFKKSVVSMVAAVLGMIPEGLYLLTTVALALSTIRLAKKQVLLHDMKSIETLARVDVLCVDKTGTITEPGMQVTELVISGRCGDTEMDKRAFAHLLADYSAVIEDNNATMEAIRAYVAKNEIEKGSRTLLKTQPFTSANKYSKVSFVEGDYMLGAPEFIMKDRYEEISEEIEEYQSKGYRVLLMAEQSGSSAMADTENAADTDKSGQQAPGVKGAADMASSRAGMVSPIGYIVLSNPIRENAESTFTYFKEQGVAIKVISGDNPATVSEVAKRAGIDGAENYVDASTLASEKDITEAVDKYTVFGRVTPKQKQLIVRALQKQKHTVAMTGDGVNDILAMKDADCSIAMASGSEAAAQAAQTVLLDSDFGRMPYVVFEGRQVVNNIQRSASLFLVKNIFSLLMAIFSAIFAITYPLEPSQISLISMFTIGLPGFLLALEPNRNRIEGNFMVNVMLKALPAGLTDVLSVGALVICGQVFNLPSEDIATAGTMLLAVVGFMIIIKISHPFNKMKYGVLLINIIGLLFCGLFLGRLFAIESISNICFLLMVVFAFAAESMFRYLTLFVEKLSSFFGDEKNRRKLRRKIRKYNIFK
ncbi:HAD family hydrolase [Coprococcus sp. AF19-8AC]|uniref:cation-translocating P-type ATPase n=1 Tax=Coprococcus sp. AF19-8AC TaxID=2293090 RepID=UPI000E76B02C|nr:HAD family hydrolase [Coprococcus sp. AF19-8AC]